MLKHVLGLVSMLISMLTMSDKHASCDEACLRCPISMLLGLVSDVISMFYGLLEHADHMNMLLGHRKHADKHAYDVR